MMQIRSALLVAPGHPRWEEFLDRLTGPDGLDVEGARWRCAGGEDKTHSRRILAAMGLPPPAVDANLRFFERHGGYCDCEVWMNVERSVARFGLAPPGAEGEAAGDDGALWGEEW